MSFQRSSEEVKGEYLYPSVKAGTARVHGPCRLAVNTARWHGYHLAHPCRRPCRRPCLRTPVHTTRTLGLGTRIVCTDPKSLILYRNG